MLNSWNSWNVTSDFMTGTYEYSWYLSQSSSWTYTDVFSTSNAATNRPTLVVTYAPGNVLTTNVNPAGAGSISGAGAYVPGSSAQITATAATGYAFTGWSGDLSGNANPTSVIMNSNKNITANFTATTTVVRNVIKDSYINSPNPNSNAGNSQIMYAGWTDRYRSLIAFDLSTIPANAVVTNATLKMYKYEGSNITIVLGRINGSWIENSVTWNNAPAYTWASSTSFSSGSSSGWTSATVTSDVRDMISNPAANFGWMVWAWSDYYAAFQTKEWTYGPRLEITYYIP
jgi:uncharacterized repeat protein (TIGR02543 family)